jgi:uncharacterized protein (TIGR03083 family)
MADERTRPAPILVLDRFAELRSRLQELLAGLSPEEWDRRTAAPLWTVKDVAAHLLGGDIGILSRRRDAFTPPGKSIRNHHELIELINELNATWVSAARRMSPNVLRDQLAHTGPQVEEYFATLDPMSSGEPVSWAGPGRAPVWLDLAREFTERWHHQQQIRDATGRAPLYERRFFAPVLDAFIRALPNTFHEVDASEGTVVKVEITGDAGGRWFLRREAQAWDLYTNVSDAPAAEVVLPQDAAWRLFTKGMSREEAARRAAVRGDPALAARVFHTISIIG